MHGLSTAVVVVGGGVLGFSFMIKGYGVIVDFSAYSSSFLKVLLFSFTIYKTSIF